MTVAPGTRLGSYEVEAALGAGGMGEVYRARDTRLERTVAIKVLPAELSANPERRQRLEREARMISSLQHPHICVLYDVGHQDGTDFLVMEYLEGENLAERIVKGALPANQVLRLGMQIADALDKAHRQGIVHRDLKPANVVVTKSGAKLLDFGLAKLAAGAGASAPGQLSALVTEDKPLTEQGALLGTLQYMAPEQLEGKEADARTDIFALGVLLHEMATGRRAFSGSSRASLIAAILDSDPPPVSSLQPTAPPALDHVIRTCLAKDPEERWQTAHDVTAELKWIADTGSQAGALAAVGVARGRRRLWAWTAGAGLLALALGLGLGRWSAGPRQAAPPRLRLTLTFPPEATLAFVNGLDSALSPDGKRLMYVGGSQDGRGLNVRDMETGEVQSVAGSEGAESPFVSPDGQWIGFFAGGQLKKASLGGGAPMVICDAPSGRGGSWGADGTIVFAPTLGAGLSRVPASGGTPVVLTKLGEGEVSHRWPQVLPGGRAVVFTVGGSQNWDRARIELVRLETGERRVLVDGGTTPRYVPTGHLLFGRLTSLLAVPFDLERLEVRGTPIPILDGIETLNNDAGAAKFTFSTTGLLAYGRAASPQRVLTWVSRSGVVQPSAAPERAYSAAVTLSPDGGRAAVTIREAGRGDIWISDLGRGTLTRLTYEGDNDFPIWSPDGTRLVFSSQLPGKPQGLLVKSVESGAAPELLTRAEEFGGIFASSWAPDGRTLAISMKSATTSWDVWMLPLEGERKPQPFVQSPFEENGAAFSPDGRHVAYFSDESGRSEIYVRAYPTGGRWQISTNGGDRPRWGPDGREIFYRERAKMMRVDVQPGPAFKVGEPRTLFEARLIGADVGVYGYDVAPDGQRFLVVRPARQEAGPSQLHVVVGWFDELRQKVAGAGKF